MKLRVHPNPTSIEQGDSISFIVEDPIHSTHTYAQPYLSIVHGDYDDFQILASSKIEEVNGETIFRCPFVSNLEPGLYILPQIRFANSVLSEAKSTDCIVNEGGLFASFIDYGNVVFEIRAKGATARTAEELLCEYQAILRERDVEFNKGFGKIECADKTNNYVVFVFVKNCLLTSQMRVGQYELIPIGGLSCVDTLQLMNMFLSQTRIKPLLNADELVESAKNGQPSFAAFFPNVVATTQEDAFEIAENEIELLCSVMSLHRSSYASIISSVVMRIDTSECYYKIFTPSYRGNKCQVSVPEEYRLIRNRLNTARTNEKFQLYSALYKECLLEERREFAYFRFWNLLETIARSKNYIGKPLKDAYDNIKINKKGHPQFIQDRAEELVFEYLRETKILSSNVEQQIPIWYRNRNCVVHSGGCLPNDQKHCNPNDNKHKNCKKAYEEMISIGSDSYLTKLRDVVLASVCNELEPRSSS